MPFCPNCGVQLTGKENYCPSCGNRLDSGKGVAPAAPAPSTADIPKDAQYRVILVDKGDCTKALCKEVLRNLLGYTLVNAGKLIDAMPVVVGQNMTRSQAVTVSEVLAEYGMNASVCDRNDQYVKVGLFDVKPVFSSNGILLTEAAATLRTLSKVNQADRIVSWSQPNLLDFLFRPSARRATPLQSALGSLFDMILPDEPPRPHARPKPPAPASKPGRPQQTVYHGAQPGHPPKLSASSAAKRASSARRGPDEKPPVPRPPIPGMGPVQDTPAPRRKKPQTGPGIGRRP